MATVEFDNAAEFLAELEKDRQYVDRCIVRISQCQPHVSAGFIQCLSVTATARVGLDIYRLHLFCGAICGIPESDQRALDQQSEVFSGLKLGCTNLSLDVRAGELKE